MVDPLQAISTLGHRNVVPSDLAPIITGSRVSHIYTCGAKATALYHRYPLLTWKLVGCNRVRAPI